MRTEKNIKRNRRKMIYYPGGESIVIIYRVEENRLIAGR